MSFFDGFFRNHENSQAKNPVNGKQTFLKKCLFWRFFEKSDRTNFFFGNGLIEPKIDERLPIGLLTSLIKRKNVIFPPKPSFWPKQKRLRQAVSRGKLSFSWRNAIWAKKKAPAASRQQKNVQNAHFFCRKNGKKHPNRHEMVIHGSKWDVDPTKMIRKARSTRIRSSYCAKTLKMRV